MLGGRDWLVVAMLALMALCTCGAVAVAVVSMFTEPVRAEAVTFQPGPKDRPVLETVQQVWEARTTGVSRFHFDGVYYIVEDLPNGYVDYSSWYVRMP